MLVLSRFRDESIIIGDDIKITIIDVRGDKVRVGIAAPTTIPVHREEVYEAIRREKIAGELEKKVDSTEKSKEVRRYSKHRNLGEYHGGDYPRTKSTYTLY